VIHANDERRAAEAAETVLAAYGFADAPCIAGNSSGASFADRCSPFYRLRRKDFTLTCTRQRDKILFINLRRQVSVLKKFMS
jgi:hypothetical protein